MRLFRFLLLLVALVVIALNVQEAKAGPRDRARAAWFMTSPCQNGNCALPQQTYSYAPQQQCVNGQCYLPQSQALLHAHQRGIPSVKVDGEDVYLDTVNGPTYDPYVQFLDDNQVRAMNAYQGACACNCGCPQCDCRANTQQANYYQPAYYQPAYYQQGGCQSGNCGQGFQSFQGGSCQSGSCGQGFQGAYADSGDSGGSCQGSGGRRGLFRGLFRGRGGRCGR